MENAAYTADAEETNGPVADTPKAMVLGMDMEKRPLPEKPYAGMDKDDLLLFSQTPFWKTMRLVCLVIFLVVWIGLLAAVIALTIVFPRCKSPPQLEWWQKGSVYQIYPRSFLDSDGDGIGDLKGIESKLDYLKELNVQTLAISSIYPSVKDNGYDVTNHTDVDPAYGSMQDFESLLDKAHKKGFKVVLDYIPNHTSDQHPWFVESKKNNDKNNPFRNFYVWSDCATDNVPNNWLNKWGESAWLRDTTRGQCYLHQFLKEEPDLNLRSADVRQELENILRFWLEKGVDGFRIDSIAHLYEDYDLRDEPQSGKSSEPKDYDYLEHIYTTSQSEVHDMVARWRTLLDEYSRDTKRYRFMMTSAEANMTETMKYYENYGRKGADFPVNFNLLSLTRGCGGQCVYDKVDSWWKLKPSGGWANWMLGDQNNPRIMSQLGEDYGRAVTMLAFTLPGTPLIYYGEELGMRAANLTTAQLVDPVGKETFRKGVQYSRDPSRTPMQWTNDTFGGFTNSSSKTPWLPLGDHVMRNVEQQEKDKNSFFTYYKDLTNLHTMDALQFGNFHYVQKDANLFSFIREFDGKDRYLVAVNFGNETTKKAFFGTHFMIPEEVTVSTTTKNGINLSGDFKTRNDVELKPGQGVVFEFPYPKQ